MKVFKYLKSQESVDFNKQFKIPMISLMDFFQEIVNESEDLGDLKPRVGAEIMSALLARSFVSATYGFRRKMISELNAKDDYEILNLCFVRVGPRRWFIGNVKDWEVKTYIDYNYNKYAKLSLKDGRFLSEALNIVEFGKEKVELDKKQPKESKRSGGDFYPETDNKFSVMEDEFAGFYGEYSVID